MTLVVSLRIPDGVVIAADSLQTTIGIIQPIIQMPQGGGKNVPVQVQGIPVPLSTSAFAQKLFSFKERFGVATFGTAIINNRTIYNHIKNLEETLTEPVESVSKAGEVLKEYFANQLEQQLIQTKQQLTDGQFVMGLQVVGYESKKDLFGHTVEVHIGKKSTCNSIQGIGCTVSGDNEVVTKLWEIARNNPQRQTNYASFSLKDGIDYAEFLINTTANFQRFSNMIPTVGGAADIALVTSYSKFTWIKYKDLTKILENL